MKKIICASYAIISLTHYHVLKSHLCILFRFHFRTLCFWPYQLKSLWICERNDKKSLKGSLRLLNIHSSCKWENNPKGWRTLYPPQSPRGVLQVTSWSPWYTPMWPRLWPPNVLHAQMVYLQIIMREKNHLCKLCNYFPYTLSCVKESFVHSLQISL